MTQKNFKTLNTIIAILLIFFYLPYFLILIFDFDFNLKTNSNDTVVYLLLLIGLLFFIAGVGLLKRYKWAYYLFLISSLLNFVYLILDGLYIEPLSLYVFILFAAVYINYQFYKVSKHNVPESVKEKNKTVELEKFSMSRTQFAIKSLITNLLTWVPLFLYGIFRTIISPYPEMGLFLGPFLVVFAIVIAIVVNIILLIPYIHKNEKFINIAYKVLIILAMIFINIPMIFDDF